MSASTKKKSITWCYRLLKAFAICQLLVTHAHVASYEDISLARHALLSAKLFTTVHSKSESLTVPWASEPYNYYIRAKSFLKLFIQKWSLISRKQKDCSNSDWALGSSIVVRGVAKQRGAATSVSGRDFQFSVFINGKLTRYAWKTKYRLGCRNCCGSLFLLFSFFFFCTNANVSSIDALGLCFLTRC